MKRSLFESKEFRYEVARYVASLLRGPEARTLLSADEFGAVSVEVLLFLTRERYPRITREHIVEIAQKDAQNRFDLKETTIRARSGHRYNVRLPSDPVVPPNVLYHGTCEAAAEMILHEGIRTMGKAYVHLSDTEERAYQVGKRKQDPPIILGVNARQAHESGVRFWVSGQRGQDGQIYLSDEIPPQFVGRLADAGK